MPGAEDGSPAVTGTAVPAGAPFIWWVLAILFGWLGGLIGFFVLRGENPRGARNVLLVGIAITLLSVLGGVALVLLGVGGYVAAG